MWDMVMGRICAGNEGDSSSPLASGLLVFDVERSLEVGTFVEDGM